MEATVHWIMVATVYHQSEHIETWSALQLVVENMPEYTDQWKINNTASHIVQTGSGDHTVSYAVGVWILPGSKAAGHEADQEYHLLWS